MVVVDRLDVAPDEVLVLLGRHAHSSLWAIVIRTRVDFE
jgi:hypothetical protein